ncbi:MAG: hypothetical protein J6Z34_04615 [Clostridia bacterium]|nr:hypothetical protein [Clostridia bacterium]
MLDKNTEALLEALKNVCPSGGYVVVSADEINEKMKRQGNFTVSETERMLAALSERGYINLRFSDFSEYCLAVLPKGYAYEPDGANNGVFVRNKALLIIFACAFAGAFAGGVVAGLIF